MIWYLTENNDSGSLRVRDVEVKVGDMIQIEGEDRPRRVTYTMGSTSRRTLCACFKGQGPVPTGPVRWGLVADSLGAAGGEPDSPESGSSQHPTGSKLPADLSKLEGFDWVGLSKTRLARPTLLIGFDSAWTASNSGGLVIVRANVDSAHTIQEPISASFQQAVRSIRSACESDRSIEQVILAIDQPIIVKNETGRRPVDSAASRIVARFGSATQPANRSRKEMFGDDAPVYGFLEEFRSLVGECSLDPRKFFESRSISLAIEVYPVLASLSLFPILHQRMEVARYNPSRKKTFSLHDWAELCLGLSRAFDSLGLFDLSDRLKRSATTNVTKAEQDRIDACICLLIAWHFVTGGKTAMLGDTRTGYMLTPLSEALQPLVERSCSKEGLPFSVLG